MAKGITHVSIGSLTVINLVRDVVHQRGRAVVAIEEVRADGVGGNVVNAKASGKRRRRKRSKARLPISARGAIASSAVAACGMAGSVAAAGIAHVLGWS